MSELAVIDSNNFAMMSQMMGLAYDTGNSKSKSTLARLRINKKPIKGQTEVNGKKVNMEIVAAGTYSLEQTDTGIFYADRAVIRPFMQRFMYQRYDSSVNNYIKTVMANSLDIDLKDTTGGFNCGKPAGYVEDFNSLSENIKDLIRATRRVRVLFGEVTLENAVDNTGAEHEIKDVPFIWEIDGKEAFKNVGQAMSKFNELRRLPVQHNIVMVTEERQLPTGNAYHVPMCEVDLKTSHEITEKDQDTFKGFMGWVENYNQWVLGEWDKKHQESVDPEDAETVEAFVDIEVEEDE